VIPGYFALRPALLSFGQGENVIDLGAARLLHARLGFFFFFAALASRQATTFLMACARASSKMFSVFKKSSMLDPRFFFIIT